MSTGLTGALLAALPVVLVLALIGLFRVKGYAAVLAGLAGAALLGLLVWKSPASTVLHAAAAGTWKGLFPVVYIVASALLLYNLTVQTGDATRLRSAVEAITAERSLHLLLIGYGFSAFLDATAGFLTPVVVATSMLVSLDFPPLLAASYTLVGSAIPAVFGAMGIPVVVLSEVTGLPMAELSPALSVAAGLVMACLPLFLTGAFTGWQQVRRLWLPVLATGIGYGSMLVLGATLFGYSMAAVAAALGAMVGLALTARRRGSGQGAALLSPSFWRPWIPYGFLVGALLLWGLPGLKGALGPYLGSPGTAILAAAILFGLWAKASRQAWQHALALSWKTLKITAVSLCAVFAMAEIMKVTGMTAALGQQVSRTGDLFPLLSPFIQWLASAITGSNTTSIAMVGGLQASTARALAVDPLRISALAGVAAAVGKMVAPQVLTAGVAAAGVPGQEARLLQVGLRFSLSITAVLALVGWLLT